MSRWDKAWGCTSADGKTIKQYTKQKQKPDNSNKTIIKKGTGSNKKQAIAIKQWINNSAGFKQKLKTIKQNMEQSHEVKQKTIKIEIKQ